MNFLIFFLNLRIRFAFGPIIGPFQESSLPSPSYSWSTKDFRSPTGGNALNFVLQFPTGKEDQTGVLNPKDLAPDKWFQRPVISVSMKLGGEDVRFAIVDSDAVRQVGKGLMEGWDGGL